MVTKKSRWEVRMELLPLPCLLTREEESEDLFMAATFTSHSHEALLLT